MANIKLPERFKIKLEDNQSLNGIVNSTLSSFGEILEDNKLYFFGEYTDHGIRHIENVIFSSDNLIPSNTFNNILKSNDIANYILSVILHDIGMHINLDGFKSLINGDFDSIRIKELDQSTWSELWEDYLNEAKKFSGKQLKSIFGNEDSNIRIPPFSNPGLINEDDKKLIGEFIRRNHPRLAHEIAMKGFPGYNFLEFAKELDFKSRNIIGLIARSHGIGLRKCLDYIELFYGKNVRRTPNNTHAIYLMVLLRLADYIQIDSKRVSKTLLRLKTFSSPISDIEHQTHLSIDYIDDKYQDDPERIFVSTSPKDSKMFLKVKKLIGDIQYEFDISWAVLGELYGTIIGRPEIRFRRITSNLEDETFISKQKYVADSFSFKANDEIVRLLISPLYGSNPTYGVRELVQNSIDACKEREWIENKSSLKQYVPEINVKVIQGKEHPYFIITDNGIGMDINIIKDYLLSAGASYRKSIEWQKRFLDETGSASIRKSGRFGIGILAAFLIGKEIEVETKKAGHKEGYRFSADLFSEQINVLKDEKVSVGTSIKIKINDEMLDDLEPKGGYSSSVEWYKWYALNNPRINYFYFDVDERLIPYNQFNPDIDSPLPSEWNSIDSPGFNKILWTYSDNYVKCDSSCNGIIIPTRPYEALKLSPLSKNPQISIFDNNAITPLTLNRNAFSGRLPFNDDLKKDIYKDFIAYFLLTKHIKAPKNKIQFKNQRLNYPGTTLSYEFENYSYGFNCYNMNAYDNVLNFFINYLLISKKGFILNYNYFLQKIGNIKAILIQSDNPEMIDREIDFDLKDRFLYFTNNRLNSIDDYKSAIDASKYSIKDNTIQTINSRIFIKRERFNYLFKSSKKRVSSWLSSKCKIEFEKYGWICLNLDKPKPSIIKDDFLRKYSKKINFIREYEISCFVDGDDILDQLLKRYIGNDVVIPFDVDARKKKYPLAFKELQRYMEKYISK